MPRAAGSSKTPHASHQGPFRTHLQFLTSQGCRFILCLCFATPLGHEGHGTGPEQGEGGQLGLGAHGVELHEVLHKGREGVRRWQATRTSKCSLNAEEPRYGFNPDLSRYQTSATKEVPLNRQKTAPWSCSSRISAWFTGGDGIWATPLPALLAHCPLSTVKAHRCDGSCGWKLPTQAKSQARPGGTKRPCAWREALSNQSPSARQ